MSSALALVPQSPEWHADRRDSLGASDAPIVAGMAPRSWGDPVELLMKLYAEKTGLIESAVLEAMDTPEQRTRKRLGLLMEDAIATWYTETTGWRLQKVNTRPRHPEHEWMRCSLDRVTIGVRPKRIVQLKQRRVASDEWGADGTAEIPEDVLVQEQHEMAVAGYGIADVAVLIGGSEPRIYTVERDDAFIADLIELESEFMACVREGRTPDFAGLTDRGRRVKPLGESEIVATPELDTLIRLAHEATRLRADAEKAEKALKAQLGEIAEPYTLVKGTAVDLIYRSNKPSRKVAWELIAKAYRKWIEEDPATASQIDLDGIESTFTTEQAGARPIRFTERKTEE